MSGNPPEVAPRAAGKGTRGDITAQKRTEQDIKESKVPESLQTLRLCPRSPILLPFVGLSGERQHCQPEIEPNCAPRLHRGGPRRSRSAETEEATGSLDQSQSGSRKREYCLTG